MRPYYYEIASKGKEQFSQAHPDKKTVTSSQPLDWFLIGAMEGIQQKCQAVKNSKSKCGSTDISPISSCRIQ